MLFVSIFVLLWAWDITTILVYIILALLFISSILFFPTTQPFISFAFSLNFGHSLFEKEKFPSLIFWRKKYPRKNEENQLNLFNKGLYDFLNDEFLLCGKEVIQGYYS